MLRQQGKAIASVLDEACGKLAGAVSPAFVELLTEARFLLRVDVADALATSDERSARILDRLATASEKSVLLREKLAAGRAARATEVGELDAATQRLRDEIASVGLKAGENMDVLADFRATTTKQQLVSHLRQESELLGTLDKARVDFDKLVAADEAASSLQSKRKEAARADAAAAIAEYDAGMTAVTAKIEAVRAAIDRDAPLLRALEHRFVLIDADRRAAEMEAAAALEARLAAEELDRRLREPAATRIQRWYSRILLSRRPEPKPAKKGGKGSAGKGGKKSSAGKDAVGATGKAAKAGKKK